MVKNTETVMAFGNRRAERMLTPGPTCRAMLLLSAASLPAFSGALAQQSTPQQIALPATPASNNSPAGVQDIVVTAQKRSERLQDVPISITAASADKLKSLGITNVSDLQKIVPGFTFQKTVYGLPVYFIRGIGFNDTTLGVSPAVSIYVDQQPLPFSPMARGATLDLERVEVLKGPQGTLFGENSTGGAINYIAAKPTQDVQAGFDLTYGRFNEVDAEAYLSGPLTDTLSARIAVRNEYQDGWQRGYTQDETIGDKRFSSGRLSLSWKPVDRVRVDLTASGWRDRSETQQPQLIAYTPLNVGAAARPVPFPLSTFPTAPDNARDAAWDPGRDFRRNDYMYNFGGRIEVDLTDDITLTSLTSYDRYKQAIPVDLDGTTYSAGVSDDRGRIHTFSQELRLNGKIDSQIKWMVGGNYEHDRVTENLLFDPLITSGAAVGPFAFDTTFVDNDQKITSKSVFGSLDYQITSQLTLQGSVRYTKQDRDFAGCVRDTGDGELATALGFLSTILTGTPQTIAPGACATLSPTGEPAGLVRNKLNQDNVAWRGSVNWKPNADTLIYANVTKGYKAGSFPTLPSATSVALAPISQESVLAYEAGAKLSAFDRRFQVTGAAFYYDYRDKQLVGFLVDPVFGPLPSLVSIPKTSVKGGELGITVIPVHGLTLSANGTYLDTDIKKNPINPTGPFGNPADFVGQQFPYTPKWQGSFDAQYETRLTSEVSAFIGATATSRSSTTGALLSNDAGVEPLESLLHIPGYTLFDLRAGFSFDQSKLRLEFWGRNVTNKFYVVSATRNSDFTTRYVGMPATYGLTLRYRFGG